MFYEKRTNKDGVEKVRQLRIGKQPDGSFGIAYSIHKSSHQSFANGVPVFDTNQNVISDMDTDLTNQMDIINNELKAMENTGIPNFPFESIEDSFPKYR